MFYECYNAKQEVMFELYAQVGSNLRRHIENNEKLPDIVDPIQLKNYMFEFAKQEFKKVFNFEWDADRKKCKPPNTKPGGRVFTFCGSLRVKTCPAKEAVVKGWMDSEVFPCVDTLPFISTTKI